MRVFSLMLVLLTLSISLSFVSIARCEPVSVEDQALSYIENVLPFDLSRYDVKLNSSYVLPQGPNATFVQESVAYTLNSDESTLYVHFMFWNGKLYECAITIISGTILTAKSYENLSEFACDYLERYQAHTGLDSTELIKTLGMVDETQRMRVSSGNLTLTVAHLSIPKTMSFVSGQMQHSNNTIKVTEFNWDFIVNGVEYTPITMSFQEGNFSRFTDNRVIYAIGNTDVTISKEQAINIAMNYIKDYSYTTANGTKISGFAVDVSKTTANLANLVKVNDTLYPCWNVILVLNQTYPDNVNSLVVVIWAGDGEVSSCTAEPFRYYPSDPNPEPATPTPEATQGVHPGNATTPATVPIDSVKSSITPETTAPAQTIGNPAEAVEIPTSNTFLMVLTAIVAITVIATTITAALIKKRNK